MVKKMATTALFYLPSSGFICLLKFIFVCLILCLPTPAQADFLDNIVSQVKKAELKVSARENGYSPYQAGQQQEVQSLDFVKLEKGVYGVPFKADLATVLKWCAENKVNIQNQTKDQVEAKVERAKEVAKLGSSFTQMAEQIFETLKNPSVDYEGTVYLLNKDFISGVQCVVGGVNRLCSDKGINDSVYSLTVSPSDQSQNLLNQGLNTIKIDFFNDGTGKLVSYAAIATYNFDTNDDSKKQYQILSTILTQKYGEPSNSVNIRQSLKNFYPYLFDVEVISNNANKCLVWKENIFETFFGYFGFSVFYFNPDVAGEASAEQVQAVQKIDQAMANVDANKVKVIQNNF